MADEELIRLRGVLFRSTIRGGHASLAIIVTSEKDEDDTSSPQNNEERMVLVVVRLGGSEWDTKLEKKFVENNNNDLGMHSSIDQGNDNMMTLLRSNIRRICKVGNEIAFLGQYAEHDVSNEPANTNDTKEVSNEKTDWHNWKRFMVDYYLPTSNSSESNVRIYQVQKWNVTQCQATRAKYFNSPQKKQQQKQKNRIKNSINGNIVPDNEQNNTSNGEIQQSTSRHHGGGIGKRRQGEIVCDFLLWMLSNTTLSTTTENEAQCEKLQYTTSEAFQVEKEYQDLDDQQYLFMKRWVPLDPSLSLGDHQSSVANRNSMSAKMISKDEDTANNNQVNNTNAEIGKGGIIDAAGGAGHVSLALALRGIHSTVVDPRQNVGKLPGRDRKALKKSKQKPFSTYRAWFGSRPKGVDSFFREGTDGSTSNATTTENRECNKAFSTMDGSTISEDPLSLPICCMCSEDNLLPNCKAIVALHPDEATGSIVETAVENEIPFLVVPCCVFSRLFPERIKPQVSDNRASGSSTGSDNNTVSTYYELIDWLVAKHSDIKVTRLPFEGANIAVWATFR